MKENDEKRTTVDADKKDSGYRKVSGIGRP